MERIAIVVPVYNEEIGIVQSLTSLLEEVELLKDRYDFSVVVVNDGSSDSTAEKLGPFKDLGVECISQAENSGYGAALKRGILTVDSDWILITDADGTYPHSSMSGLLNFIGTEDMVVGARTGEVREVPFVRKAPKWLLTKLASWLSRRNIPDLNSGFRLMRRSLVMKYLHLLPDGFSFTTTITLALLSSGYRVKYISVNYHKRSGKSKIKPFYDTVNFIQLIIRTIVYFEPLRVFIPLSFIFVASGFLWLLVLYLLTGKIFDTSTMLFFFTGVQMLAIGMLADMINRRIG